MIPDVRKIESVAGHLLGAVGRAFVKILGAFLGFGIIGGGAVEGANYFVTNQGAPTTLTHIAAGIFGVILGYAAGLTVAVTEAIRALLDAGKEAVTEVGHVEQTIQQDGGNIIRSVEGDIKRV